MFASFAIMTIIATTASSMTEEEAALLEQRAGIRSLELSMETKLNVKGRQSSYTSTVWCDGTRLREDRVFVGGSDPIREIRCFDGTELIYWKTDEVKGEVGIAIHRWRVAEVPGLRESDPLRFPTNPRLYGLVARHTPTLTEATISDASPIVGFLDRHNVSVTSIAYRGRQVRQVAFETALAVQVRILLDPSQNGNAVLMEAHRDDVFRQSLEAEYAYHQPSKVWFPKKLVYANLRDGQINIHEAALINVKSINTPIDPKIFTLAGMEIPSGKEIASYPADPRTAVWDGEREIQGWPIRGSNAGSEPTTWIGRAGVVLCVVIGVIAMFMFLRRIGTTPSRPAN